MQQATRRTARRALSPLWLPIAVGILLLSFACVASSSGIPWDASRLLDWGMFRCTPPADAIHRSEAAAIHMTIRWHASYSVSSGNGGWTGRVQCATITNTMEPSLSWMVPGKCDDRVLEHEQAHFNLNEVYRRKLEVELGSLVAQSATKDGALDTLNAMLHRRAGEILSALQSAQARYDAETDHGNNAAAQARWESNIARWLDNPNAVP